jgi:hypothetical protein
MALFTRISISKIQRKNTEEIVRNDQPRACTLLRCGVLMKDRKRVKWSPGLRKIEDRKCAQEGQGVAKDRGKGWEVGTERAGRGVQGPKRGVVGA